MLSACLRRLLLWLLLLASLGPALAQSLRFGVIGDSGAGDANQRAVARQMEIFHKQHRWQFVLMLGDNIYETGDPRDFDKKFKNVYQNLVADGVRFHAALGNHDRLHPLGRKGLAQVEDDAFGFLGREDEYELAAGPTVAAKRLARFLCLNSDAWLEDLDARRYPARRLARLRAWLRNSGQFQWNFVFFHNPIYSFVRSRNYGLFSDRLGHGPEEALRQILEPEMIGKVDVVLCGHEHFYQKIRPQSGIHHIISGGGSKIRKGVVKDHPQVESAAEALHFVDFQVSETQIQYQAVSDKGIRLHAGTIRK